METEITSRVDGDADAEALYLSHFPVFKSSNPSKVRSVFDAACKSGRDHKNLNNALFSGPNMMNDLAEVFLDCRAKPVPVVGDVRDMFLMISLAKKDRKYHRFLWVSEDNELIDYEFNRLVFGVNCSPSLVSA